MEFINLVAASEGWQALLDKPAVTRHQVAGANHTFSRRNWRDEVATCTEQWLKSW
jgi:hypothetical protein